MKNFPKARSYVGVDIDSDKIKRMRRKTELYPSDKKAKFLESNVKDLKLMRKAGVTFDVFSSVHYSGNVWKAVSKVVENTKKGGHVVIFPIPFLTVNEVKKKTSDFKFAEKKLNELGLTNLEFVEKEGKIGLIAKKKKRRWF